MFAPKISGIVFSGSTGWQNTTLDNCTTGWNDNDTITLLGAYSDEFNNGTLDTANWFWIRENATQWVMGDTYIQINSTPTDMYQSTQTAPLLLRNVSSDNMSIVANVSGAPDADYEGGGLIFYADDDNFVSMMYYYGTGGTKVILKKEDNNVQEYTSAVIGATDPIYLKITKVGNNYTGYYSANRTTWVELHEYTIADTMTDAGILAYGSASSDPEPFQFDFFMTDLFSTGNTTHWYDAGTDNRTYQIGVNATTPANTNYTVWVADNGTEAYTQISGGALSGSNVLNIDTRYQNTDVQIRMNGVLGITPELYEVEFYTRPIPVTIANETGQHWINYTWTNVSGNVSYEVYVYENS